MVWVVKHGRDFAYPDYKTVYPREPEFKLNHVVATIWLHVLEKYIDGTVDLDITPNLDSLDKIVLDAVEMEIKNVMIEGEKCDFYYDGSKLEIYPQTEFNKGENYIITVEYRAHPRKGLHFIVPNKDKPNIVPQVWSQGEPEDTRWWLPIYDYPNNKTTWELIVYAPKDFTVLSNGTLVETRIEGDWVIWHWKNEHPMSTYLITLVAGIFDVEEEDFEGIPLKYYVPKGMGQHIWRSFSKTKDILKFFSEYTGVKYPYPQYIQVCVNEFIWGGMENTALTVLTEWTLHDEKAHEDFESEPLVAHEAAHQWFGDLVTTKDWGNIWLNESFATYMENLYRRHWKGEDEFVYAMYQDLKAYLMEYGTRYARPIVTRVYKYPEELFDRHSYPKGCLVLHALNNMVGETNFREALNRYLEKFKYKNADTEDLRKIFEEVTGLDLEWFFDQYVYNAGHPVLGVKYQWISKEKFLRIDFEQKQKDDSLDVYRLAIDVEIIAEDKIVEKTFQINEKKTSRYVPLDKPPKAVLIDPRFKTFVVIDLNYKEEELLGVLRESKHIYPKLQALEKIPKFKSKKVIEALYNIIVNKDEFWGVRYHAAEALGKIGTTEALEKLIKAEKEVLDKKVRRAVIKALGNFKDGKAADVLKKVLKDKEESYYVRMEAAISLGKTKIPEVMDYLLSEIDTPSHAFVITRGVLRGLAELGTDEALDIILRYTDKNRPTLVRVDAVMSLGKFPRNKKAYERIRDALRDENMRVRGAAIAAIKETLDPEFMSDLNSLIESEIYDGLIRSARDTIKKIREHMEKGTEYKKLVEEIEKIREENRHLIERLERLEYKS